MSKTTPRGPIAWSEVFKVCRERIKRYRGADYKPENPWGCFLRTVPVPIKDDAQNEKGFAMHGGVTIGLREEKFVLILHGRWPKRLIEGIEWNVKKKGKIRKRQAQEWVLFVMLWLLRS